MTDKVTLSDLVSLQNETSAINTINANSAAIVTAFDNTLSRDGTSPNTMGASLDMNSNAILNVGSLDMISNDIINVGGIAMSTNARITNLGAPINPTDAARLQDVGSGGGGGGGGGTPGGSNTQVQYNNAGSFGGISGATTDGTTLTLVAPVLGTPASGTATNLSGTAAALTAGHVTTNANLTGGVTSVGNATTVITNANLTGDVTSTGNATTVGKINGTALSGLSTGILKNTTTTGVPSIAIAADFPTLNQNTTGNAATVTTNANLTGDVTSVGNATTLTNAPVIAKVLTGYTSGAGTVSATDSILSAIQKLNGNDATNANLTGPITSVGNATSIASQSGTGSTFVMTAGSPTFTGTPAAPTATAGTNTTQLATTAFALANGPVASVFGRTGVVTAANGDYTPSNITYTRPETGAVAYDLGSKNLLTIQAKEFGAKGNAIKVNATVSITSGAAALTATGATFVIGDIGKDIHVTGAGAAGATLVTTISSFTDSTHVGLAANASTTLTASAQSVLYGKDDTVALQAFLTAIINNGGGRGVISAGQYMTNASGLAENLSSITTRLNGRVVLEGEGVATVLHNVCAATVLTITDSSTNPEAYFQLESIAFSGSATGVPVVGSKGLVLNIAAFGYVRGVDIEEFDYGFDAADVEQLAIYDTNFRFCNQGMRFQGAVSTSDTNSILLSNTAIGNNQVYGAQVNHANAFKMTEGSIQYNGKIGGGTGQYGMKLTECGTGYGTVSFDMVAIEGNGGNADVWDDQTTNPSIMQFTGCGFARTLPAVTTITGAANNGSGLIRLTVATTAQLPTGTVVAVAGVLGTTEANGQWTITNIDTTHIDLQSSTFTHTYSSGGIVTYKGYATNCILATGTNANTKYILTGNSFRSFAPYVPNASRLYTVLTNTSCKLVDLANYYQDAAETPSLSTSQLLLAPSTFTDTTNAANISSGVLPSARLPSGSYVLLATLTASSSATLSDTTHINSTYDDYEIVFENLVPSSATVGIEFQVHSGGSFQNTGYINSSGAVTTYFDFTLSANTISTTAGGGFSGAMRLNQVNSTSVFKPGLSDNYVWYTGASTITRGSWAGVWNGGQGAIDGFQVLMTTGNISTGIIKIFGIVK